MSSTVKRKRKNDWYITGFIVASMLAGGFTLWINVQPYIRFGVDLVGKSIGWGPIFDVPMGVIFGVVLFSLIQLCECYPIWIKHNKEQLKKFLDDYRAASKVELSDDDTRIERSIKREWNGLPLVKYRWAKQASLVAYTVDLIVLLIMFPPVDAPWGEIPWVLLTGQFNRILFGNIIQLIMIMFMFEVFFTVFLTFSSEKTPTTKED